SPVREKSPAPEKLEVVKKDNDVNGESTEVTPEEKPVQVGDKKDESTKSPRYKSSQKETYTKYDLAGEEALDYGEEEDDEDRNEHDPQEFSWTRRSLRLKNKAATSASTCKWKFEEESKLLVVKSELLNKYYEDIKLVPLEQLKLEEKTLPGSDTKVETSRKPSISQEPEQEEPLPTRTVENIPTVKRTVSIVSTTKTQIEQLDDAEKQLTPPRNPPSSVLLITNLVRPFTLPQLKEMLQRTGNLVDIWVDKIKSKCIAKFDSQEEAFETRAALHGVCWPSSNPKSLHVDYTTLDNLDDHKAKEGADQNSVSEKPMSAQPVPVREWDVGKKAEPKSPRSRKRSRSRSNSRDRAKRSRRSSSPGRRRHSRSPGHADRRGRGVEGKEPEPMGKALDELFRKTVATPSIYWLPLTPEQIAEKEELRRKRMLERERRLAELSKMRPR
ncbi:Apoptotic chromatin condensation inducer in the nucleus, partial [Orchesella cincta]